MAYLFETEEDEAIGRRGRTPSRKGRGTRDEDDSSAEITLGTRSLLGIFFGLVLICSIFFGLGYSVGRGSAAKAAATPVADETTPIPTNAAAGKPSAQQGAASSTDGSQAATATPASGTPEENAPALEPAAAETPSPAAADAGPAATASQPSAPVARPAGFPSEVPGASPAAVKPAVAAAPSGIMVQVAAISVPQDADILVGALKKRGYSAVIRNEPQDKLLHVQLGPFATRAEANAMRAKLLADGYNAVVK